MIKWIGTIVITIIVMVGISLIGYWGDIDLKISAGWTGCLTYLLLNKRLK